MKLVKALLERSFGKGSSISMMTDLPDDENLKEGNVISLDDRDTQWTIKKIYHEESNNRN